MGASILFLIAVLCIDLSSDCKAARNNDSFAVLVGRIAPATNLSVGRGSHRGYLETAFFCCVGYSSNIWSPSLLVTNSQSNSFFLLYKILEQSHLGKPNDLTASREILSHRNFYFFSPWHIAFSTCEHDKCYHDVRKVCLHHFCYINFIVPVTGGRERLAQHPYTRDPELFCTLSNNDSYEDFSFYNLFNVQF